MIKNENINVLYLKLVYFPSTGLLFGKRFLPKSKMAIYQKPKFMDQEFVRNGVEQNTIYLYKIN